MPLLDIRDLGSNQFLATWQIEESTDELWTYLDRTIEDGYSEISHEVKQKEFVTTRLLCKELVKGINQDYHGVQKDEYGKPWLKASDYFISVTHCYPLVSVILDLKKPVGIDLERSRQQISRIAPKFMSEEEYGHSSDPEYQLIMWAAKEALYKLHGRKSLEFRSQLLIDPFEVELEGLIAGNIINGEIENHTLYYRFLNDRDYVLVYSKD